MVDGDLKLSQSLAIEQYIAGLSKDGKFSTQLTAAQRAKDIQFSAIKDDLMSGVASIIFGDKDAGKIKEVLDKWFPLMEGLVPAEGFINGLAYPTLADFSMLLMHDGFMPYGAAYKFAGFTDGAGYITADKYPKCRALIDRIKASEGMADYLAKSSTMANNPFGL